uniref:Uncharacterized protein n=1 Tax=Ditylenchus dipsaci TaxID=166011 RepID=A0A915DNJ9_9BILA
MEINNVPNKAIPYVLKNYWYSIGISLAAALSQFAIFSFLFSKDPSVHTIQVAFAVLVSFSFIQRANFFCEIYAVHSNVSLLSSVPIRDTCRCSGATIAGSFSGDYALPIPTFCSAMSEAFLDYLEDLESTRAERLRKKQEEDHKEFVRLMTLPLSRCLAMYRISGRWISRYRILNSAKNRIGSIGAQHIIFEDDILFVKASNMDNAKKIFRLFHGNNFAGCIVNATYMAEDEFVERFPATEDTVV